MIGSAGRSEAVVSQTFARKPPPYYFTALGMGIPAILIGIQISAWVVFFSFQGVIWTRADFRDIYTSGYMVRSGYAHQLYNHEIQRQFQNQLVSERTSLLAFDHLAYETLLFIPFSYFPYRVAYFSFMAWNATLLVGSFFLIKPFLPGLSEVWKFLPIGIFLGFLPVTIALMLGQDSLLILALFTLATVLLHKSRDFSAGALVGLAFFKFQIVIPIAFLFLVWRRWRVFGGICLSAALATATSCLLVGLSGMRDYINLLTSMSGDSAHYQYGLITVAMPNLRGLMAALMEGSVPASLSRAITVGISIVVILGAAFAGRLASRGLDALPVAVTAATLVSYHILIQDLSMLLIPVSLTLEHYVDAGLWKQRSEQLRCFAAAAVLVIPSVAFLSTRYMCVIALAIGFLLITLLAPWSHRQGENATLNAVPADV